jgi:hypothetical protein
MNLVRDEGVLRRFGAKRLLALSTSGEAERDERDEEQAENARGVLVH